MYNQTDIILMGIYKNPYKHFDFPKQITSELTIFLNEQAKKHDIIFIEKRDIKEDIKCFSYVDNQSKGVYIWLSSDKVFQRYRLKVLFLSRQEPMIEAFIQFLETRQNVYCFDELLAKARASLNTSVTPLDCLVDYAQDIRRTKSEHAAVSKLLKSAFTSSSKKVRENLPYIIYGYPRGWHYFLPILKTQLKREDNQDILEYISSGIRLIESSVDDV